MPYGIDTTSVQSASRIHWNQVFTAAKRLEGCSSTGIVMTAQLAPWSSTVSQMSGAVQSSRGIRLVIASSMLTSVTGGSWYIARTRFGLEKVVAVHAQIQSTRTAYTTANTRRPLLVVPGILPRGSTVIVKQYASSVPTILASSVGTLSQSSGSCHVQVFAYGYGSS
jgi:hypothetical protein